MEYWSGKHDRAVNHISVANRKVVQILSIIEIRSGGLFSGEKCLF